MTVSTKIVRQFLACSSVISNLFVVGLGFGWVAPALVKLSAEDAPFKVTSDQASWIASTSEVGKIFGPFIAPWLVDSVGRKLTVVLVTFTLFAVWLSTVFVRNFYLVCAIRATYGLAGGVCTVVAGIYMVENCSPNFRGVISSVGLLAFFAGLFAEYVMVAYLSYVCSALANTALAGCAFATLYYCVETPYFLTMKGKRKRAEKNLLWLSGGTSRTAVMGELGRIERSLDAEKQKRRSLKSLFSSPANLKGIVLAIGLQVCVCGTGATAVNAYGSLVFSRSETFAVTDMIVLYGAAQIIAVAVTSFIIERMDRRWLVVGCYCGVTGSNICSYLLMYARNKGYEVVHYPWLIFGSVTSYSVFVALMSPANYALTSELLPFSVRAIGTSMAVAAFSLLSFGAVKSFVPVTEYFGTETNFLAYAVVAAFATIVLFYALPETRGKTLHELQNLPKIERAMVSRISGDDAENKITSRL